MTTGTFWNVDNPLKPWGRMDPDAVLDIVFDWQLWFVDVATQCASHTITCEAPLECVQSQETADGLITSRIRVDPDAEEDIDIGKKYSVTCHIVAADGQEDDRTVYLKMVQL